MTLRHNNRTLLTTYLGQRSGTRVLNGEPSVETAGIFLYRQRRQLDRPSIRQVQGTGLVIVILGPRGAGRV